MNGSIEQRMAELQSAGWQRRSAGDFMDACGPLWARRETEGWAYAILAQGRHLNPLGRVHGGLLHTLADHALSLLAWEASGRQPCATVQSDAQFIAAAHAGELIVARGSVAGRSQSMLFLQGGLWVATQQILRIQAIFKIYAQAQQGNLSPSLQHCISTT